VERLKVASELQSDRGPLVVKAAIAHQDRFIVTFDRITTREDAELWRGVVLRAPRLNDEDTIWIDELFDAQVYDASGVRRGRVVAVEANPASDIMVLDTGVLVPLTFVTHVQANVRIAVEVPEGLFE
jgi:16S rRNA processing protein RimM